MIYDSQLKIIKNEKTNKEISFYCGNDLNFVATILAKLTFNKISLQDAYTTLISMLFQEKYKKQ